MELCRASAGEESLFDHPTAAELHEEERRQQVKRSAWPKLNSNFLQHV
jgi:hypothetical protein